MRCALRIHNEQTPLINFIFRILPQKQAGYYDKYLSYQRPTAILSFCLNFHPDFEKWFLLLFIKPRQIGPFSQLSVTCK